MTWSFDENDNTQGWRAREHFGAVSNPRPLLPEVRDGVMRVDLTSLMESRRPIVELVSPPIDEDSGLFDRVSIRLRTVHTSPVLGYVALTWTNEYNRETPGQTPPDAPIDPADPRPWYYGAMQRATFLGEWQEVTISDLAPQSVTLRDREFRMMWEGQLRDIRLAVGFMDAGGAGPPAAGIPEAVEVDWIRMTGVEEQLQGELRPPDFTVTTPFGDLLAPAHFWALGTRGVATFPSTEGEPAAALGDLDGDGDLDLVARWQISHGEPTDESGWLYAVNDGVGGYRTHAVHSLFSGLTGHALIGLRCADINDDGVADVILRGGYEWGRIMLGAPEGSPQLWREWEEAIPLPRDADGDGDTDVYLLEYERTPDLMEITEARLYVMDNDGLGNLAEPVRLPSPIDDLWPWGMPVHVAAGRQEGVLCFRRDPPSSGLYVTSGTLGAQVQHMHLAIDINPGMISYIGDIDGDGDIDIVHSDSFTVERNVGWVYTGLTYARGHPDGTFESAAWLPEAQTDNVMQWADLDGDGCRDAVFVERANGYPAVVVYRGVADQLPIQEGRYPLDGTGGGTVLTGDLDNDGDTDVAVLEPSGPDDAGGVHVLLNRVADRPTVVTAAHVDADAVEYLRLPEHHVLRTAYPNPFNPRTTIPVTLPWDVASAQLRIFSVLGQPVRTLFDGPRRAGVHRAVWDGQDDQGRTVPSGVYFCRLLADGRAATGTLVHIE